jgi:hypothetical protein
MRRSARWDGAAPLFESVRHGHPPTVAEVGELRDYVLLHRAAATRAPFDLVMVGATTSADADVVRPLREIGDIPLGRAPTRREPGPAFGRGGVAPG